LQGSFKLPKAGTVAAMAEELQNYEASRK